jgi:hypothetical protein
MNAPEDEWNTLQLVRDLDAQLGCEEGEEEAEVSASDNHSHDHSGQTTDAFFDAAQSSMYHHYQQQHQVFDHQNDSQYTAHFNQQPPERPQTQTTWSNQQYLPHHTGYHNQSAYQEQSAPFYANNPPSVSYVPSVSHLTVSAPPPTAPLHERAAHLDRMRRQREAFLAK